MGQPFGIEKASLESKNIYWAHLRGLKSEKRVIDHYLKDQLNKLVVQRLQTPFGEIDLLFLSHVDVKNRLNQQMKLNGEVDKNSRLLLVEVKSLSNYHHLVHRLTWHQRKRLMRSAEFIQSQTQLLVEVHLAFVNFDGSILIINEDF